MKPAPLIIGIFLSLLLLFATTMVVVRFVPGAGEFFGGTSYDLYADGHCETQRNAVTELSYALLGKPGKKPVVTWKVKVLDPVGVPIPQASVRVQSKGESRSGTTDSGGRVELRLGKEFESAKAVLWVDAPGYVDSQREVAFGDEEVSVRLVRLVLFRGSLVDERGQPIQPVRIYANGCGPVGDTAVGGTFELSCQPDFFPVVVMGMKALREEDAFRLDGVKVQLPQREGEVATLTGRRSGARARITLPGGSVGGSWVRLAHAGGRDASTVEPGWQEGDTFGFLGLEEGHWWVYFHRDEEPLDALHRTELVAIAGKVAELQLPLDAPLFTFDRSSSR